MPKLEIDMFLNLSGSRILTAFGVSLILLSSCGEPEKPVSKVAASVDAVGAEVITSLPEEIYTWSEQRYGVYQRDLNSWAKKILAEKLRNYGLIPSQVSELFSFKLVLSHLRDCEVQRWGGAQCDGSFSFKMELIATEGQETLDHVARRVKVPRLSEQDLKRVLEGGIDVLLKAMIENGTLSRLNIETPYF